MLARGRLMCGMMGSIMYRVAAAMAISQGRLISPPIGLDAAYEWPFVASHFGQRDAEPPNAWDNGMWNNVLAPFLPPEALRSRPSMPAMSSRYGNLREL